MLKSESVILLFLVFIVTVPNLFARVSEHPCHSPKNPLCQKISKLAPHLDLDFSFRISNDFHHVAKEYDLPSSLLISIAMQESTFNLQAVRKVKGYLINEKGLYETAIIGSDFCMMQINIRNIIHFDLDPKRLVTDSRYCIAAGAKILNATMKRFKGKEEKWWTRYNSSNPVHRKNYGELVLKYWRTIDPVISYDFQLAEER